MRSRTPLWLAGAAAALVGLSGGLLLTAEPPKKADADAPADQLKPNWQVGQQWVVETISQLAPVGEEKQGKSDPVRWQFTVKNIEPVGGHDCFRVNVEYLIDGREQAVAVLWADQKSLALRQVQSYLQVQGETRTVIESYSFADGQPAPVVGLLTAVPLDMPLFLPGASSKAIQEKYVYEANAGPPGKKALGEVGFAVEVEQNTTPAKPEQVKALLAKFGKEFSKDLEKPVVDANKPLVSVSLKTADREVNQLWQPSLPWPAFVDNGTTVARLVQVTLPKAQPNK